MRTFKFPAFKICLSVFLAATLLLAQISPLQVSAEAQTPLWPSLKTVLQPIIDSAAKQGIQVSVGVKDLSGTYDNQEILLGSPDKYYAASTIKMAIVALLMQEVEAGRLRLEDKLTVNSDVVVGGSGTLKNEKFPQDITIERLARLMIVQSDNTATNVLIDLLTFEKINALIDNLGFDVMQLGRKMLTPAKSPAEDNYVNAAELLALLDMLYSGSLVSDKSREQIITWMKGQEVKTKFGAALPGKPIAHKTGELGDVSHDIGYFLEPGKEIAIVVLTKITKPEDAGKAQELGNPIVQRVARAVYNYLLDNPSPAPSPDSWPALILTVSPIIEAAAKNGIRVSVGLKDLSTSQGSRELLLGSHQSYAPASTIKMALVSALMQEVDDGQLSLDQKVTVDPEDVVGGTGSLQNEKFPQDVTIERLARLMITQSDNTATNVLIDAVGLDKVDALMNQLGLKVMHLGRKMFAAAPTPAQDNYIDASDLAALLEKIYKGDFLSGKSRDQIITWMKAQEVKTKFGAALSGLPIAHKTGENGNVTHDSGYFLIPGREVAIAVMTEVTTTSSFDEAQTIGNPVVQEIARAVYHTIAFDSVYTDVNAGHWARSYIEAAAAASLVKGTSESTFSPERLVTRAEFVSMLVRAFGLKPSIGLPTFVDVAADSWFAADVAAAQETGIANGQTDHVFNPSAPISRTEMVSMIIRAYEYENGSVTGFLENLPYKDINHIPAWSKNAVLKTQYLGLINGYEDGTFRPSGNVTRAEAVKSLVYSRIK